MFLINEKLCQTMKDTAGMTALYFATGYLAGAAVRILRPGLYPMQGALFFVAGAAAEFVLRKVLPNFAEEHKRWTQAIAVGAAWGLCAALANPISIPSAILLASVAIIATSINDTLTEAYK